jgi:hypothetical protein
MKFLAASQALLVTTKFRGDDGGEEAKAGKSISTYFTVYSVWVCLLFPV